MLFLLSIIIIQKSLALNLSDLEKSSSVNVNFEDKYVIGVEFSGASDTLKKFLEDQIWLNHIGTRFSQNSLDEDLSKMLKTGTILDIDIKLTPKSGGVILSYLIKESSNIKQIELKGNLVYSTNDLITIIQPFLEQRLNLNNISPLITAIEKKYITAGYSFAKVLDVLVQPKTQTLVIVLDEGLIEKIDIVGLTQSKAWVVARELESKPGTPLNLNTLRKDRENLLASGFFSQISTPKLIPGTDQRKIIVIFDVTERKANLVGVSLEQLQNNHISIVPNLKLNNYSGTWESISLRGQVEIAGNPLFQNTSYILGYYNPWFMQSHVKFFTNLWDKLQDERQIVSTTLTTYKVNRRGFDFTWQFPIAQNTIEWMNGFSSEYVTDKTDNSTLTPYQKRSLITSFLYDSRDNKVDTTAGTFLNLSLEKGGQAIIDLGGLNFFRAKINAALFIPAIANSVIATHLSLGYYDSDSNIGLEEEKFYIGGSYSLRGYPDFSTVTDPTQLIAGRHKILINLEYRIKTSDIFQLIFFMDIGNAFDGSVDMIQLKVDRGIGFRISTPIAPVRLDLAWGDNANMFFCFGLGQLF